MTSATVPTTSPSAVAEQRPVELRPVRHRRFGWRSMAGVLLAVAGGAGLSACASSGAAVSRSFAPSGHATATALAADAAVLQARLHAFGVAGAATSVSDGRVVVRVAGSSFPTIPPGLLDVGRLEMRPVLCGAPASTPGAVAGTGPLPACAAPYDLTAANLHVNPTTGQPASTPSPDPVFAPYASTTPSDDQADAVVLLPVRPDGFGSAPRLVLGPAPLSLGPVAATSATHLQGLGNLVDMTLTAAQAKAWDVLVRAQFHALVGIDVDGTVLNAPLTQPTQTTFSSFSGRVQLSGDFDATSARVLAAQLVSGPLAAPLRP